MERQSDRDTVVAKLAEWGITLSESELDELLPAYQKTVHEWQGILEAMLRQRKITDGMIWPESEPLLIHCIEKQGGPK